MMAKPTEAGDGSVILPPKIGLGGMSFLDQIKQRKAQQDGTVELPKPPPQAAMSFLDQIKSRKNIE